MPDKPLPRTIITTWELWSYDVWGNAEDGYDVNDRSCIDRELRIRCKVQINNAGTPAEFASASPSDYQLGRIFGTQAALDTDGDDLSIYVSRARDGYPLGALICTSHDALSPIRLGTGAGVYQKRS
jgi:hypothetical protein